MDPLSVSASVVALIGAAGKVYSLLETIASAKESPAVIRDAQAEVKLVEVAVQSLERQLHQLELVDPRRKKLVLINDLVVSLADAMMAMSEFEKLLAPLTTVSGVRSIISWLWYSKRIEEHLTRTQRHKSSLTMMTNILQCESDMEAMQSRERLHLFVENILTDNKELRKRLGELENSFDASSRLTHHTVDSKAISHSIRDYADDSSTITSLRHRNTIRGFGSSTLRLAFEHVLLQSRVYQRNEPNECDRSFVSSAYRSHAWSMYSGYSLADISVLSVIAMPIANSYLPSATVVTSLNGDKPTYTPDRGSAAVAKANEAQQTILSAIAELEDCDQISTDANSGEDAVVNYETPKEKSQSPREKASQSRRFLPSQPFKGYRIRNVRLNQTNIASQSDNYQLTVLNLPLVEQTRMTRIAKRLEDCRDKTEFWLPAIAWRSMDYMHYNGAHQKWIYTASGRLSHVKKLQRKFDEELDVDLFEEEGLNDINVVASLFKIWLRDLPDDILPKSIQDKVMDSCIGAESVPQQLIDELSNLPPFNYYLLYAISGHLSLVLANSDQNKLDYKILSPMFMSNLNIGSFCLRFLVCEWNQCWKGCRTEELFIQKEYEFLDSQAAKSEHN